MNCTLILQCTQSGSSETTYSDTSLACIGNSKSSDNISLVGLARFMGVTYFIRESINVCKDTSSVKIVWADCDALPYALVVCVVDGLSLDSRNRACEPPASHIINRGSGNRS